MSNYHSDLILKFQFGQLSKEQKRSIPTSTRYYWKHKCKKSCTGPPSSTSLENKRLREVCKALAYIVLHTKSTIDSVELVKKVAPGLGLNRSLRLVGISRSKYYRKRMGCPSSLIKKCYRIFPQQLSYPEIQTLSSYITKYSHWDRKAVWYRMVRDKAAFFSLSTFYTYATLLHGKAASPSSRRLKHSVGLRASKPFEWLHADVTIFKTENGAKLYIYLLVDNFSRAILGWQVSTEYSFRFVMENLETASRIFPISKANLLTDGGVENMAAPVQTLLELPQMDIAHFVAQSDVDFSNSMVEAVNKRLKYMYLYRQTLMGLEDTIRCIDLAVKDLNGKPHGALFGLSPS